MHPDEEIKTIFRKCLEKAKADAILALHAEPNHYIINIKSIALTDNIDFHLRTKEFTLKEAINILFARFEQNKWANTVKHWLLLCSYPLTVDITTVTT